MEETIDQKQSSDQSFAVILVIGSLIISSLYFLINEFTPENEIIPEEDDILGESILSIPEAPDKPVEVPKPPAPKNNTKQQTPEKKTVEEDPEPEAPEESTQEEEPNVDEEKTTEKKEEEKKPKPEIRLTDTNYKDKELDKEDPVYFYAEATSDDYKIKKVEYYLNGDKKVTVNKREMRTKKTKDGNKDDLEKAFDKAKEYIIDEYSIEEDEVEYDFRQYFEKDGGSCDVDKGYLLIVHTKEKFYEIRVSEDFKKVKECTKGVSINYYDTYAYLFKGTKNDYKVYAKAYDTENNTNKTETLEFELK